MIYVYLVLGFIALIIVGMIVVAVHDEWKTQKYLDHPNHPHLRRRG
jgi:hypothetical protein